MTATLDIEPDATPNFATTADQHVHQLRRTYSQEAARLIRLGFPSQAEIHMNECLRLQARVSGIRLEEPPA